jgi:putative PIN family toxin of toxin-antitoxin system
MNIVLDTNIIISSAISTKGNSAKIIDLIHSDENIQLHYSNDIFAEYKKVLAYERLKISAETQKEILEVIKEVGMLIEPVASDMQLPDESDRIFYDTAKAVDGYLITGNLKHYPEESHIISPAQFIKELFC